MSTVERISFTVVVLACLASGCDSESQPSDASDSGENSLGGGKADGPSLACDPPQAPSISYECIATGIQEQGGARHTWTYRFSGINKTSNCVDLEVSRDGQPIGHPPITLFANSTTPAQWGDIEIGETVDGVDQPVAHEFGNRFLLTVENVEDFMGQPNTPGDFPMGTFIHSDPSGERVTIEAEFDATVEDCTITETFGSH